MNKNLFLFLLSFLTLSGSVIGQMFNAAGTPAVIPDPGNVNLSVTVSGLGGTVATADEIQLNFNINHLWGGDVVVGITPPGGSEVIILNRAGGGSGNYNFDSVNTISFRSNASGQMPYPVPANTNFNIPTGVYLPTGFTGYPAGSFSSFVGASRDGIWNIRVSDDDAIVAGIVSAASITFFTAPSCTTPTAYNVTGGGIYCAGGAGVAVGLDNSETGVNYQLQLDGANDGDSVAGIGSPISFGNKTAVGTYTVVATTAVGSCTANMTGSVVVSTNISACYCTPIYSNASCVSRDFIDGVVLNTINNTATDCAISGANYSDYTAISTSLSLGSTYPITITPTNLWQQSATVWIDFDHSGTFDVSEIVFFNAASNLAMSGTVSIPATAMLGNTIMRVRGVFALSSPADPCSQGSYGETEDYTINIICGVAPSITASTYTPCGGTQVTLTAVPAPGFTGAEYLWLKNGIPANSQNGGPGTYTVNAGTTAASNDYTLQMVYTGSTCLSATSTAATIVTSIPTAVITPSGPTTFCTGTSTTLNANTGTGLTYQWKRGSTIVQVGGASYIPTTSGSHTLTVTDALGCKKVSTGTAITINALPTANAGADKALCKSASVQIGSANNIANTYTWSPTTGLNNPYISNPTLATNVAGTYMVSVTNAATSCNKSDAMVVTSISGPATPSVSKTINATTITLTSVTPGATSVNWYSNGALLFSNMAANSSINVVASNPAKAYTVKSKGTNGCLSSFSNFVTAKVGDGKTGDVMVEIDENVMQAYPNPTNGLLNVVINDAALTGGKLLLYNNLGQVVVTKEITFFAGKANTTLDLQTLVPGVYSLSFENKVIKVVKE